MAFKDHFSERAADYAKYRPHYPKAIFKYLSSIVERPHLALDCATGSGQAACGLAPFFDRVVATDASMKQISNATRSRKVSYTVALGEQTPLRSASVDLVTVAQALHWLTPDKFFTEMHRVLKPGGYIAVWCYNLLHVHPRVDIVLFRFYTEIVGPYWPPERKLTEEGYSSVPFPFEEKEPPSFDMNARWDLNDLVGYLRTWSASQKFVEKNKKDPIKEVYEALLDAWGEAEEKKRIRWPVTMRLGANS